MHIITRFTIIAVAFVTIMGCGSSSSTPDGEGLLRRAQQSWTGDWHAVWQVEWDGAPVREPLTAEVWHAADGRLRIETLEVPSPALSGLTLVEDGNTSWLYDLRHDEFKTGLDRQMKIPLTSDAMDTIDWLLANLDESTLSVSGRKTLESGLATRMDAGLSNGDRVALWIHDETGLPSRVELHSAVWGEAAFIARSVSVPDSLDPDLFVFQQIGGIGSDLPK